MKAIRINFFDNDFMYDFKKIGKELREYIMSYLPSDKISQKILDEIKPHIINIIASRHYIQSILEYESKYIFAMRCADRINNSNYIEEWKAKNPKTIMKYEEYFSKITIDLVECELSDLKFADGDCDVLYIPLNDRRVKVFVM